MFSHPSKPRELLRAEANVPNNFTKLLNFIDKRGAGRVDGGPRGPNATSTLLQVEQVLRGGNLQVTLIARSQ